jgi:hypothetical protein
MVGEGAEVLTEFFFNALDCRGQFVIFGFHFYFSLHRRLHQSVFLAALEVMLPSLIIQSSCSLRISLPLSGSVA